jgi:hypothetical protein
VGFTRKLHRLLPLRSRSIEPDAVIDLGQYVRFPGGYRPHNPSIVRYGQNLLVCVRGVAYEAHEKFGFYRNPDGLPSLNRLFLMDNDMRFVGRPAVADDRLDGLEDLKLFGGLGRIWAVGGLPIGDPKNFSGCVITLVEFNPDLTDCRLIQVQSPLGFRFEKNWAPFVADDALHFIYSCQPLVVLRYDPESRSVSFVGPQQRDPSTLAFLEGGSSGGFTTASGTVFLTHRRVVRLPSRRRVYLCRVRCLSRDFTSFRGGQFFSIRQPGKHIQFANGMLLDDDRVLITYGETDSAARLACFSTERFRRLAFPRA